MKSKITFLLLFICTMAFPQARKALRGIVRSGDAPLAGVSVINNKTGDETKTDSQGNFNIAAKPGDKLAVYSDRTETREFAINKETFKESPYTVSVNYKSYELDEVEIDKYKNTNSEALGLVPKGQKQYTTAERRLKTAGDFKPIMLLGLLGGQLPLDPIINAINGRTKMLKGALATERKEMLMEKINNIFTAEEITAEFDIPEEYLNGFIFYIVEDKEFGDAVKSKNNDRAKFLMAGLAKKYLDIIKDE